MKLVNKLGLSFLGVQSMIMRLAFSAGIIRPNKAQYTATRLLKHLGTFPLDMSTFTSFSNNRPVTPEQVCGTTFCLAGYLAMVDKYPEQFCSKGSALQDLFDYSKFSAHAIGSGTETLLWDFMFSCYWNDSVECARKRMNYVIVHGTRPPVKLWHLYGIDHDYFDYG